MTNFEQLKKKAEELKTQRDQALGVMRNIEDGWEQKFGTRDVKVVKEKVGALETELKEVKNELEAKLTEAEKILEGK